MNEMTKLLADLIKIKSVSGNENEISQFIFDWLKESGIKVTEQDGNIVAYIKGVNSKKALIFNGHMDTVPPGDIKKWKYGPFEPTVVDGKMYGLGASDMKGSLVVMMMCAKKFNKIKPSCDLWFTFVVKEEVDGSGTKESLNWLDRQGCLKKYHQLAGIIGEPTGLQEVELGHRGNVFLHVTVTGQSGHGSRPEEIKKHSIKQALQLVERLEKIKGKWQEDYCHKHLGAPTVGWTGIQAGDFQAPNKFPDQCKLQFDFRTTPSMHQDIKKEIGKWLDGSGAKFSLVSEPCSYGWCDSKEKIVKIVRKIVPKSKLMVSKAATDQCFYTQRNIPAIIFGPGEKKMAHQTNEYFPVNQLEKAFVIYSEIISNFGCPARSFANN
jgi:acetylornithine deacetylase/succinyl-diaminopimelate desuccinylase family protein